MVWSCYMKPGSVAELCVEIQPRQITSTCVDNRPALRRVEMGPSPVSITGRWMLFTCFIQVQFFTESTNMLTMVSMLAVENAWNWNVFLCWQSDPTPPVTWHDLAVLLSSWNNAQRRLPATLTVFSTTLQIQQVSISQQPVPVSPFGGVFTPVCDASELWQANRDSKKSV